MKFLSYIFAAILAVALLVTAIFLPVSGNSDGFKDITSEPTGVLTDEYEESDGTAKSFKNPFKLRSKIPVVHIWTFGKEPVQEKFTDGVASFYYNYDGLTNGMQDEPYFSTNVGVKRRGFASYWNFGDKYAIKLELRDKNGVDVKYPLFGFPAESDWAFHSTYADKSLVKNYFCYTLAQELRVFTPRIQMIELVLHTSSGMDPNSSDYRGVYAIVESIKQGKGRINIADFQMGDPKDTWSTGGGYIVARDKVREGETHFFTTPRGDNISYVYPRWQLITDEEKKYIEDEFTMIESVLFSDYYQDPEEGWRKYIDSDSMIDYILLNELVKNQDGYIFSSYMTRDVGGKLQMGPVWDFDVGFGRTYYGNNVDPEGWYTMTLPWPTRLCSDPYFADLIARRWAELRKTIFSDENIESYFDECIDVIGENARERNFARFPILFSGEKTWPQADPQTTSYEMEVRLTKNFLIKRANWMDNAFPSIVMAAKKQ